MFIHFSDSYPNLILEVGYIYIYIYIYISYIFPWIAILRHPIPSHPIPPSSGRSVLEIRAAAAVEDEAHGFAALRRADLLADVLLRLAGQVARSEVS